MSQTQLREEHKDPAVHSGPFSIRLSVHCPD